MDELSRLGIDHWRGERVEFERRGKNRTAEPYTYPALPNYVWLMPEPAQVHMLSEIEYLSRSFHFLRCGRTENKGADGSMDAMSRFKAEAEQRLAAAKRAIGNREAIAEYAAGDRLEIRDGPFAGELATFSRIVHRANELFPTIKADIQIMGGTVPIELDPLSVRKAV